VAVWVCGDVKLIHGTGNGIVTLSVVTTFMKYWRTEPPLQLLVQLTEVGIVGAVVDVGTQ
jgi:hypothetical protein